MSSSQELRELFLLFLKILDLAGFPVLNKPAATLLATATTEAAAARAEALGTGAAAAKTVQAQPLKCHQEILH